MSENQAHAHAVAFSEALEKFGDSIELFNHFVDFRNRMLERYEAGHENVQVADTLILQHASKMQAALNHLIGLPEVEEHSTEEPDSPVPDVALRDLSSDIAPIVLNALRSRQIETVGQVLTSEKQKLLAIRNMGPQRLHELEEALIRSGYQIPWERDERGFHPRDTRTVLSFRDLNVAGILGQAFSMDISPNALDTVLEAYYSKFGVDWKEQKGYRSNQSAGRPLGTDIHDEESYFRQNIRTHVRVLMRARHMPLNYRASKRVQEMLDQVQNLSDHEIQQICEKLGIWPDNLD